MDRTLTGRTGTHSTVRERPGYTPDFCMNVSIASKRAFAFTTLACATHISWKKLALLLPPRSPLMPGQTPWQSPSRSPLHAGCTPPRGLLAGSRGTGHIARPPGMSIPSPLPPAHTAHGQSRESPTTSSPSHARPAFFTCKPNLRRVECVCRIDHGGTQLGTGTLHPCHLLHPLLPLRALAPVHPCIHLRQHVAEDLAAQVQYLPFPNRQKAQELLWFTQCLVP